MTTPTESSRPIRLRYVNSDHTHPLRGVLGTLVVANRRKGGPKNELVRLDDGRMVVAPYGNWRPAK